MDVKAVDLSNYCTRRYISVRYANC